MDAKCRTRDTFDRTNLIESDWAACFDAADGIQGGTCPNNFIKIEDKDLCPEVYGRKRVCCLVVPTLNVKVN